MSNVLPPPWLLGAPRRYDRWRLNQDVSVLNNANCTKPVLVRGAPTGFGKTLSYLCTVLLTQSRTIILTSTKALSKQIWLDWAEMGLVEIRGLNSYECVEGRPTGIFGDVRREGFRADAGLPMMCDEAPCQSGVFCRKSKGGCLYYDAYNIANSANIIVTNYAYWMSINRWGEGLGRFDLMVLDEAHNAIEELGSFVGTEIKPSEIEAALPGSSRGVNHDDVDRWREWALRWNSIAVLKLEEYKAIIRAGERKEGEKQKINHTILRKSRDLRRVQQKLETVATMRGDWVIEWQKDSRDNTFVRFDPVWPGEYAKPYLFLDIPKIIMTSATVRPETAIKLGVPKEDIDFVEYPSTFPKQNRPFIWVPTAHMNKNSAESGKHVWHLRMDQIMDRRPNVKGIIHTVSYPRAKEVYYGSEFRSRLLLHDSSNTKEVIEEYKRSTSPVVIVSPVLDTGYDFPHDQCRFQIVAKMPFPVTVDKITQARMARDKGYRDYVTMVKLVQMAGRPVRAEDDWAETFIVDDDFQWWWKRGKFLVPRWFAESVRFEQLLGMPLTKAVA